jgi:hypothetical protein
MPDRPLQNVTPAPRRWKVVGLELVDRRNFCGRLSSATVGCPDDGAPILCQVGLTDS